MERDNRIRGDGELEAMFQATLPKVRLAQLPLAQLDPWQDAQGHTQPFHPYAPDKLLELVESIRQHGILEAIRVRPKNGRFEILAGHNRCAAARLAGLTTVPATVEDVDDDQAALILVESNLMHREKLLPSEKAWAYRLQMEAIKRRAGRPLGNSCQVGTNLRSDEELAQTSEDSARQIQRYIRLTYLHQELLELVDQETIKFIPAVVLSYLSEPSQELLVSVMQAHHIETIINTQAVALRQAGELTEETILDILCTKKEKPAKLRIQPNMTQYPAAVTRKLAKDPDYLDAVQKLIEDFTASYIEENGIHDEPRPI